MLQSSNEYRVRYSTKISTHEKAGETKHRASPPLQKVGGHVLLSTHESTPMDVQTDRQNYDCEDCDSITAQAVITTQRS